MERAVRQLIRLTSMALAMLSFSGFAQNPLKEKLTFDLENVSIEQVLRLIEKDKGIIFSYNASVIDVSKKVTIEVVDVPLSSVIEKLFDRKVEGKHRGNYIILLPIKKSSTKVSVSGTVYDKVSGKKIPDVAVVETVDLRGQQTNSEGGFELMTKESGGTVLLAISSDGYRDTLVEVVDPMLPISVSLSPLEVPIKEQQRGLDTLRWYRILSNEDRLSSFNRMEVSEERFFQFSLLPGIGTNRFFGEQVVNNFSINLIAGANKGVNGFELGGAVNFVTDQMFGLQIAGFGNYVMGDTKGCQIGGFSNNAKSVNGLQVAGFYNTSTQLQGTQLSGFFNHSTTTQGAAIAGFMNLADTVKGAQIAGVFNKAKRLSGVQIAPVNICDSVSSGVMIGLVNLSENGLHRFEYEYSDIHDVKVNFKSGVYGLYTILSVGYKMLGPQSVFSYGGGLGSQIRLSNSVFLNAEIEQAIFHEVNRIANIPGMIVSGSLGVGYKFHNHFTIIGSPVIHYFEPQLNSGSLVGEEQLSTLGQKQSLPEGSWWPGYKVVVRF